MTAVALAVEAVVPAFLPPSNPPPAVPPAPAPPAPARAASFFFQLSFFSRGGFCLSIGFGRSAGVAVVAGFESEVGSGS